MNDAARRRKAVGFAVHLALYESLRALAPSDPDAVENPLGPRGDAARVALRRAWVATHSRDYDDWVPEPDVERAKLSLWMAEHAADVEAGDGSCTPEARPDA